MDYWTMNNRTVLIDLSYLVEKECWLYRYDDVESESDVFDC